MLCPLMGGAEDNAFTSYAIFKTAPQFKCIKTSNLLDYLGERKIPNSNIYKKHCDK